MVSCQPNVECDFKNANKNHQVGRYKLSYVTTNSVSYQSIPLASFRTLAMSVETRSAAESIMQKPTDPCGCLQDLTCGLLDSFCPNSYTINGPFGATENTRYLTMDYVHPHDDTDKKMLTINIHQSLTIPTIQQWTSHFQGCCPSISGVEANQLVPVTMARS